MLSEHDWRRTGDGEARVKIKSVVVHPEYHSITEHEVPVNDFALLELEVEITILFFFFLFPFIASKNSSNFSSPGGP